MKHVCKSVCVLLVLIMFTNFSFSQHTINLDFKISNRNIIYSGDIHKFVTTVRPGQTITWANSSKIRSIIIRGKGTGTEHIFDAPIPTTGTPTVTLRVDPSTPRGEWCYSIIIETTSWGTFRYDPKIAVKPSTFSFTNILLATATLFSLIIALVFGIKLKNAKAELAKRPYN